MGLPGLIDTATIKRKLATDDGYGGVSATPVPIVTGWKCRLSEDFSVYARTNLGRGGRQAFVIQGDLTTVDILRGDVITIGSSSYEVGSASKRRDASGPHHWYLLAELL